MHASSPGSGHVRGSTGRDWSFLRRPNRRLSAAAHPDRVGSLIISGAPLVGLAPVKPSATYRLLRFLNQVGLIGDVRMEEIRRSRGSADYRAATGVMREILVKVVNESYEEELEAVRSA